MQMQRQAAGLILASKSPRRRALLAQAGLDFTVIPSTIDEGQQAPASADIHVRRLAVEKACEVAAQHPPSWVIGADTVVLIDDRILGKPADRDEARQMLRSLSGRTHRVYTGYSICCLEKSVQVAHTVVTDVTFKTLSAAEIQWYIHTPEPFDKAGAYAIQGLGTFLVRRISGSYTNVVGLPVCEVIEGLTRVGALNFRVPTNP